MLEKTRHDILGRFLASVLVISLLAPSTHQWLLNPFLQKELQSAQAEFNRKEDEVESKATKNFISELRSKPLSTKAFKGGSPFPFDPDRGYINIFGEDGANSMWY